MIYRIIIVILLVGIIAYLFWPAPKQTNPDIIKHETEISKERQLIDSLLLQEELLRLKLKEDSLKNVLRQAAYKREIQVLKKKLSETRPEVQPYLDSIPVLKQFVAIQDSIIHKQDSEIDNLNAENLAQRKHFESLLKVADEKFNAATEINDHFKAINDIQDRQNKKMRKINAILKVSIPAAFVVGLSVR